MSSSFKVGEVTIGDGSLFLIAGPCVIESEEHALKIAECVAGVARALKMPYIFKASYDKANRTSVKSYRGPGMKEGLAILRKVADTAHVPVLTDVHDAHDVAQAARRFKRLLRWLARHRNAHRREAEFLADAPLGRGDEQPYVSMARLLLEFDGQPLPAVHALAERAMERGSDGALERLEKKNQHEEQNARGRFRRKYGRQPSADSMHESEIEKREKRRRKRVHQVPLRSELEEIPGIGATSARKLLARFGSVARVRAAAPADLTKVITRPQADRLSEYFRTHP